MSDLLNRAALDAAIYALLNNSVPVESIEPDEHRQLLADLMDTMLGLDKLLRYQNATLGYSIQVSEGDAINFENSGNQVSVYADTLTTNRIQTLQDKDGIIALLSDIGGTFVKKWYVSDNGNNTTGDGSFSNPYLTITKAQTMASAGETIHVFPGTYTNDVNLGKDGVYYYFDLGAKVIPASPEGTIMWSLLTAKTVYVGGYGEFVGGAIVRITNASAKLFMQCLRIERINGVSLSTFPCITVFDGFMNIYAAKDITSNNHHCVNWRGACGGVVEAQEFIKYKATDAYQATCVNFANITGTELITVRAPKIIADIDPANVYINSAVGINVNTATIYIDAEEITSNAPFYQSYNYGGAVTIGATNTGNVTINGNISSTYAVGLLIFGSAMTSNVLINGNIQTTNNRAYVQSSNSFVTINGDVIGSGDAFGEAVSHGITGYFAYAGAGTTYFNGAVKSLYNDATGSPIKYYGGSIIFGTNAKLIATHASAEGITSTAAQTYRAGLVQSNRALNASVTNLLTAGTTLVDANVI